MSAWRAFQRSKPAIASSLYSARAISTTGIDVLRRPVGVGFEPAHSVGRPAFGSPAATAAARSAATSGGGPPPRRDPARIRSVGAARPRRLDARRLAGLLGVVRRPRRVAQALRLVALAQLEQRLERPDRVVDPGARVARSPRSAPGTVSIVNASASTVGTSSQVSGVETRASGSGRTE